MCVCIGCKTVVVCVYRVSRVYRPMNSPIRVERYIKVSEFIELTADSEDVEEEELLR